MIQPVWCWNQSIPGKLGQYHGCWWPGSLRPQGITSHVTDFAGFTGLSLHWRISSACLGAKLRFEGYCKFDSIHLPLLWTFNLLEYIIFLNSINGYILFVISQLSIKRNLFSRSMYLSAPFRKCEIYGWPCGNYWPAWLAGGDFSRDLTTVLLKYSWYIVCNQLNGHILAFQQWFNQLCLCHISIDKLYKMQNRFTFPERT